MPEPKPYAVVDVETDSLAANYLYLVGVFIPKENKFYCHDFHINADSMHPNVLGFDAIQGFLDNYICIFHNSKFDMEVLERYGWSVGAYEDTLLMSYVEYPGRPLHIGSIKHNAKKGTKKIKSGHSLANWGNILGDRKIDYGDFSSYTPEMIPYCEQDCRLTWKAFMHLDSLLCHDQLAYDLYSNIELPFVSVIIQMEQNGLLLDTNALEKFSDEMRLEATKLEEAMRELVPYALVKDTKYKKPLEVAEQDEECIKLQSFFRTQIYEAKSGKRYISTYSDNAPEYWTYKEIGAFNPNSHNQIAWALQYCYDWKPEVLTDAGHPSVGTDVLEELEYPLAELLVQRSKPQKMSSTYGSSLLKQVDDYGFVHGHLNQTVTLTGRLSSSSPNIQNLPKHGEMGDTVRKIFVAPDGYKTFAIDCSNFQMRICAWYLYTVMGESYPDAKLMWDDFNHGHGDPHLVAASVIFDKPQEEVTKHERFTAKKGNFGDLFGVGVAKLSAQAKISRSAAEDFLQKKRAKFPSVGSLKESIIDRARSDGGVFHTLYGRRLVYPDLLSKVKSDRARAERQIFNAVIQGTEADIMKLLVLEVAIIADKYNAVLCAIVHDELFGYVKEKFAEGFLERTEEIFSGGYLPGLVMIGDGKVGHSWYDCH